MRIEVTTVMGPAVWGKLGEGCVCGRRCEAGSMDVLLTHVRPHRLSRVVARVVACESAGCVEYYMLKHRGGSVRAI